MNPNDVSYTWIGFNYDNSASWEDGSSSSITSSWRKISDWDDYSLRNSQPVLFIRQTGAWSFDPKTQKYQFICEKSIDEKSTGEYLTKDIKSDLILTHIEENVSFYPL